MRTRSSRSAAGKGRPKTVLTCPQCGSTDLYYETALITGYKYHCKKCGYIGAFVIERDVEDLERERRDNDEGA